MILFDEFSYTNTGLVDCIGKELTRCFSFVPDQLKQSPVIMMFNQMQNKFQWLSQVRMAAYSLFFSSLIEK